MNELNALKINSVLYSCTANTCAELLLEKQGLFFEIKILNLDLL